MRLSCPNQHASVTALVNGKKIFRIGQKITRLSPESVINKVREALKRLPVTQETQEALSALSSTITITIQGALTEKEP